MDYKKLKAIRKLLNLSTSDIGNGMGLTRQQISLIECGKSRFAAENYYRLYLDEYVNKNLDAIDEFILKSIKTIKES